MVSIIVPVYNTEQYLQKCIDSLLWQTYSDLEVILVDDGSTDQSGAVCDAYAAKDGRIKVVHQQNTGVSDARNAGLAIATGEYVAFVDSDDWVSKEYIEALLGALVAADADLAVCGMFAVRDRLDQPTDRTDGMCVVNGNAVYKALLCEHQVGGYLWNKLFKRKMLGRFDNSLHLCEDFVFCAEYARGVSRTVIMERKLCYYWQDPQRKHSMLDAKLLSLLNAQERLLDIYADVAPELCPLAEANLVKAALNLRARYLLNRLENADMKARFDRVMDERYDRVWRNAGVWSRLNLSLTRRFPVAAFKLKSKLLGRKI